MKKIITYLKGRGLNENGENNILGFYEILLDGFRLFLLMIIAVALYLVLHFITYF